MGGWVCWGAERRRERQRRLGGPGESPSKSILPSPSVSASAIIAAAEWTGCPIFLIACASSSLSIVPEPSASNSWKARRSFSTFACIIFTRLGLAISFADRFRPPGGGAGEGDLPREAVRLTGILRGGRKRVEAHAVSHAPRRQIVSYKVDLF